MNSSKYTFEVKIEVLKKGSIGYKAIEDQKWNPKNHKLTNDKEWSAFYVAETKNHAEQNAEDKTYIQEVCFCPKVDLKVIEYLDPEFGKGTIGEDEKAKMVKSRLKEEFNINIGERQKLMPTLGELGFLFKCYEQGMNMETAIPNIKEWIDEISMKEIMYCKDDKGKIVCTSIK